MVKKRVGGAHRYKSVGGHAVAIEEQTGPKPPQHLQKKLTKKAKFFEKVVANNAALQVEKGIKKKKARSKSSLPNLQSLAGELEQLAQLGTKQESQRPGKGISSSIKRSKARLAVTVSESQRLQQVLQHPMYKADPIQAITNHLAATMPAPAVPKQQRQQGSKKNSKKKKANVASTDMQD